MTFASLPVWFGGDGEGWMRVRGEGEEGGGGLMKRNESVMRRY
jgi:hypothetical protein